MFFPKLRRKAKWVFLLLAIIFGGGFIVFGVGTGAGSGIGDYLAELMNRETAVGGTSAEEARKKLEKNPKDAQAQLALANALLIEQKTDEAIAAFERYTAMKPRDTEALEQLAGLYAVKGQRARERAQAVSLESGATAFAQELQPADSKLAQAFQDPISQAVQTATSERTSAATTAMQTAYRKEASVYQKLALLQPDDPEVYLNLGRASYFAGDTASTITAWERYLELAPDGADAPIIRQQLQALKKLSGTTLGG